MRTLALLTFVLVVSFGASTAHAQSCPSGCTADLNGACYLTSDGVTPCGTTGTQSGGNTIQTQSGGNTTGGVLMNPLGEGTTINSFLLSILNIITNTVGPVIVILMLVYVGFKFVTAQGAPAKIAEARGMLLWTLVGALILLGAKAIAMGIQATVSALSTG